MLLDIFVVVFREVAEGVPDVRVVINVEVSIIDVIFGVVLVNLEHTLDANNMNFGFINKQINVIIEILCIIKFYIKDI